MGFRKLRMGHLFIYFVDGKHLIIPLE